jgi:hypothetical protein
VAVAVLTLAVSVGLEVLAAAVKDGMAVIIALEVRHPPLVKAMQAVQEVQTQEAREAVAAVAEALVRLGVHQATIFLVMAEMEVRGLTAQLMQAAVAAVEMIHREFPARAVLAAAVLAASPLLRLLMVVQILAAAVAAVRVTEIKMVALVAQELSLFVTQTHITI